MKQITVFLVLVLIVLGGIVFASDHRVEIDNGLERIELQRKALKNAKIYKAAQKKLKVLQRALDTCEFQR